jgi:hypothetical protein
MYQLSQQQQVCSWALDVIGAAARTAVGVVVAAECRRVCSRELMQAHLSASAGMVCWVCW